MSQEIKHRPDVGAVLLRILNGLKHTPQTIGPLLGVAPAELEKVIQGKLGLTEEIEKKLVSVRGINQRDFYPRESQNLFPIVDDTNEGVVICRKEDTIKSLRAISRGPNQVPYYIYGDMAMSNLSTIKPELIRQLYVHDGKYPNLPDWAFNKGHFEHQMTYFVGPVNFHWKGKDGQKHVCQMSTGDTNYIVPFVPHSFTTRKEGEGLILAVTYEGAIAGLKFQSTISSLSVEDYLKETLIKTPHVFQMANMKDGVIISRYSDATVRDLAEFNLESLISPLGIESNTGIFKFNLKKHFSLTAQCDLWGYNFGATNIVLCWDGGYCVLEQGDSFLIRRGVSYVYAGLPGGRLLQVQVDSAERPYPELALIEKYVGEEGLRRVHTETTRWY